MSAEQDKDFRDLHREKVKNFLAKEAARPMDYDYEALRKKFQDFIETSGCNVMMIVELPDTSIAQFQNIGMPIQRGLGLLDFAQRDHSSGMTCQRTIHGIRIDREFGRTYREDSPFVVPNAGGKEKN